MKMTTLFHWWFLLILSSGYGLGATMVGPFSSREECEAMRQWREIPRSWPTRPRMSPCWSDEQVSP